jgi:hypothetical protein
MAPSMLRSAAASAATPVCGGTKKKKKKKRFSKKWYDMSNYTGLPAPSPESGLSRYMQEIRKFPMLNQSKNIC